MTQLPARLRNWLRTPFRLDGLFALAERSRAGLRQLLGRHVDLDAWRPRRRKKRGYWPEAQVLETRMVPSITVHHGSYGGYAGIPITYMVAYFDDSNGLKGPGAYAATLHWGDGTADSPGVVAAQAVNPTEDAVYAVHTYAKVGTYSVTITVTGDGATGSTTGPAVINPPTTSTTLLSVNAYTNQITTGFFDNTVEVLAGGTDCGCTNPAQDVTFNANTVAVQPIFQTIVGTSAGGTLPSEIDVQLTWNGTAQSTVAFNTTGHTAGDALLANVQVASPVTTSGSYAWSTSIQVVTSGVTVTYNSSGTAHLAVSSAAEGVRAGNGWTFAGVNRLVATSDGVIWKDGAGFGEFFGASSGSGGGTTYASPPGEFGTLAPDGSGGYTYSGKGGLWTDYFDSSGLETRKVTADGQTTTFSYSGVNLTKVTNPDGRAVTFTYDGSGNLQTM